MSNGVVNAAYIIAAILFILSLGGLSNQEKARRGNLYGMLGMGIAILATLFGPGVQSYWVLMLMVLVGVAIPCCNVDGSGLCCHPMSQCRWLWSCVAIQFRNVDGFGLCCHSMLQ